MQTPNFLICPDESRVLVRRDVQITGESIQLIVGYLSMSAVICAAAYRGGRHLIERGE